MYSKLIVAGLIATINAVELDSEFIGKALRGLSGGVRGFDPRVLEAAYKDYLSAFDRQIGPTVSQYNSLVQAKSNACDSYTVGEVRQWHPSRGQETFTAYTEGMLPSGALSGFFA